MSNLSWTEDYSMPILICPHCYAGIQGITFKDFKPDYYGEKVCNCPNCNSKFSLKEAMETIYRYAGPIITQMDLGTWTDGNSSSTGSGGHEATIPPVGEDPEAGK